MFLQFKIKTASECVDIFDLISDDRRDVNLSLDYFHVGFGIDMNLS